MQISMISWERGFCIMKMKKNIFAMLLAAVAVVYAPTAVCSAAYITAYEQTAVGA